MSVIKSKRGESNVQFLDTAHKLYIFTIHQCVKFPKRYTFYVSQEVVRTATALLENTKRANSIYPTNKHEVQMRRDYLLTAYADVQALISQLSAASEIFPIPTNAMRQWMEYISEELKLLKGVMKRDRTRYKDICADGGDEPDEDENSENNVQVQD